MNKYSVIPNWKLRAIMEAIQRRAESFWERAMEFDLSDFVRDAYGLDSRRETLAVDVAPSKCDPQILPLCVHCNLCSQHCAMAAGCGFRVGYSGECYWCLHFGRDFLGRDGSK
jgi:hypothetical protein